MGKRRRRRRHSLYPSSTESVNQVSLLVDGAAAYPAMLEAIAGAKRTILMGSYIFHNDKAGRLFAEALGERARDGVAVYLVVDGVGTLYEPSSFFAKMERSGVNILVYRPPAPWRRGWGLLRRDHRKFLVVDGQVGFVGGINIGDEWLSRGDGGHGWHDIHVAFRGPAVRELSKLAAATWRVHGKVDLSREFLPPVDSVGDQPASIVGSRERRNRKVIRRAYLHATRKAQKYIYIANAYFLPEIGLRRALRNAVKRGVDVRVMVPAHGDILPVQLASEAHFGALLRAGVRIFRWQEAVLHAKSAVIDDDWATVGSYNLDHRSWAMNLEVNINVLGPEFATALKEVFLADQEHCEEVTKDSWRRRPFSLRLLERFCYLFRRLM